MTHVDDLKLHYEGEPGKTLCGKKCGPPRGGVFFTADDETFEQADQPCDTCQRIYWRDIYAMTDAEGHLK